MFSVVGVKAQRLQPQLNAHCGTVKRRHQTSKFNMHYYLMLLSYKLLKRVY